MPAHRNRAGRPDHRDSHCRLAAPRAHPLGRRNVRVGGRRHRGHAQRPMGRATPSRGRIVVGESDVDSGTGHHERRYQSGGRAATAGEPQRCCLVLRTDPGADRRRSNHGPTPSAHADIARCRRISLRSSRRQRDCERDRLGAHRRREGCALCDGRSRDPAHRPRPDLTPISRRAATSQLLLQDVSTLSPRTTLPLATSMS